MSNELVGLVDSYEDVDQGCFVGGLLVVDRRGLPVDARWAKTARVTPVERILYGKKVVAYVCIDCISLPLLQSAASKPDLILVCRDYLLDLRPHIEQPVFLVKKEASGPPGSIAISTHKDFASDLERVPELDTVLTSLDPMEVFDRLPPYLREAVK